MYGLVAEKWRRFSLLRAQIRSRIYFPAIWSTNRALRASRAAAGFVLAAFPLLITALEDHCAGWELMEG